jgi:molybdopterin-synthase adenylyltransferase
MRAAVVGLGALGSELVRQLALRGSHALLLIDFDRVEPRNIGRDLMYSQVDVGLPKAEALAQRCRERFRENRFESITAEIGDVGWELLKRCDVLFGCVDRDSARLEMARIGTRLGLPVCDGGLSGSRGRMSWFRDSCFGCRLTGAGRRELLRGWQSQPNPCGVLEEVQAATGATTIASATAAVMLGGGGEKSYSLELRPHDATPRTFELPRSAECPFHEDAKLMPVTGNFADELEHVREVAWEWPICTAARCQDCFEEWRPYIRTARLRANGRCPACGSARVLVLEALRSVSRTSDWIAAMPWQIGLPERHLYVMSA